MVIAEAWGGTNRLPQRTPHSYSSPVLFLDLHLLAMCDLWASSSLNWASVSFLANRMSPGD